MILFKEVFDLNDYSERIIEFFRETDFNKYLVDKSLNKENAAIYSFNIFSKDNKDSNLFIALNEKDSIVGLILFCVSDWDTRIFKKKVGIVKYFLVNSGDKTSDRLMSQDLLNICENWAKNQNIEVLITKISSQYFEPVLALQNNSHIFYECVTETSLKVTDKIIEKYNDNVFNYRFPKPEDKSRLLEIAKANTYQKSHFYLDNKFDVDDVNSLYFKWIEGVIDLNKNLLVIDYDNDVAGMFVYEIEPFNNLLNNKYANWKFAAIDSKYRGNELGKLLFGAAVKICLLEDVGFINSSLVEKNLISQKLHSQIGFGLSNTFYTFHKWFI